MKIALLSDIHGNFEALSSILTELDKHEIRTMYCLGDIVGYGASPNECVEELLRRAIPCIAGNHDKAVTGDLPLTDFSTLARFGVEWTQSHLRPDYQEYLAGLPMTIENEQMLLVHSSPEAPEEFRYVFTEEDAAESLQFLAVQLCFIGHTHRPAIFCDDGVSRALQRGKKFLVNVGSIGQPRDGDWKACCAVFDDEQYTLHYLRVEYDVASARRKILEMGLPKKLGDRLIVGV